MSVTASHRAREAFLQQILAMEPEYATGFARGASGIAHKTIWNEGNLREALGIPVVTPAPILFTIEVSHPIAFDAGARMRFEVTAEALAKAAAHEAEQGIIAGAFTECQRLIKQVEELRQRIFTLEGGLSTDTPAVYLVAQEVARARAKYPVTNFHDRIDGFVQEAGEAMQALLKLKHNGTNIAPDGTDLLAHAREEVIQAAGQCVRLLEEAL